MADPKTLARPYAQALFDLSQNQLEDTLHWIEAMASYTSDQSIQQFILDPKNTPQQIVNLFFSLWQGNTLQYANSFLQTLIDNKRTIILPEIATQFRHLLNRTLGIKEVTVYSAFALNGTQTQNLKVLLEKRFSSKLRLNVVVDNSLIGGVRIVLGDQVIDTSVKARLTQMKEVLLSSCDQ
jgi:F-type H+-transporting ATPase subunit delta